ncbi:hypothetical protein CKF48_08605 [Cytobacillus kochii]|uniref:Uncharacterized protein n=1 Tax=Cytobacillus kochii TaxID=859143 RepID=A0A248TH13_9BACI|nr:hypothetical protein CKF48_08605 [Cytobacillus kochii]
MGLFFEKSKEEPIKAFMILRFILAFLLLFYIMIGIKNTELFISGWLYFILAFSFLLDSIEAWIQKGKYKLLYMIIGLLFLWLFFIS